VTALRQLRDYGPDHDSFREAVVEGLSQSPKRLPCKFFYDERGSRLFEEICELEEYYLTRTELAILRNYVSEMAQLLGPRALVVEYGSGASVKTRLLLDALEDPVGYVPIDISREHLSRASRALQADYPALEVLPVCADYTESLRLPATRRSPARRAVFFPGSTFGNFEAEAAREFMDRVAEMLGPLGSFLIGLDLVKDREILERAYNDGRGVTAEFNLNLLDRINRELGGDFDRERYRHYAFYNEAFRRIEMHLESLDDQVVHVGGSAFTLCAGERIWTESSHKFALEDFREFALHSGFAVERVWMDPGALFCVQLLQVEPLESEKKGQRRRRTPRLNVSPAPYDSPAGKVV
jgi:dimethylhistidine N-methyltransferase